MDIVNLTEDNFEQTILENDIVLLDFWAPWCGPCLQFAPIFEEIAQNNSDILFAKINTEDEENLAQAAQIQAIPTLMAFKNSKLIFNQPGALDKATLTNLIEEVRKFDTSAMDSEETEDLPE